MQWLRCQNSRPGRSVSISHFNWLESVVTWITTSTRSKYPGGTNHINLFHTCPFLMSLSLKSKCFEANMVKDHAHTQAWQNFPNVTWETQNLITSPWSDSRQWEPGIPSRVWSGGLKEQPEQDGNHTGKIIQNGEERAGWSMRKFRILPAQHRYMYRRSVEGETTWEEDGIHRCKGNPPLPPHTLHPLSNIHQWRHLMRLTEEPNPFLTSHGSSASSKSPSTSMVLNHISLVERNDNDMVYLRRQTIHSRASEPQRNSIRYLDAMDSRISIDVKHKSLPGVIGFRIAEGHESKTHRKKKQHLRHLPSLFKK